MISFKNKLDKDIYQTYNCVKTLFPEFEPILGGTSALYLQNCIIREPKDIDIFFIGITEDEFQEYIKENSIEEPITPLPVDWQCWEYIDTHPIKLLFYDLIVTVQPIHELIRYKSEYLGYKPGKEKYPKHLSDIKAFYDICKI